MKYFYLLFGLVPALLAGSPALAQISIDEVDAKEDKVTFEDKLKSTSVDVDYFSLARYKAERAAIRKERNYLEFSGGIQGSLTSYNDPWISVSGGDNSIALTAVFGLRHLFTKNLFTLETKFNAKLGYNRMKVETTQKDDEGNEYTDSEGIWFKNQDEFVISVAPSFKMSDNWSYGSILNFRSQFVNGYKSRTEQKEEHLKSKFMTPAYLDISLGITYKSPKAKFPIVVNISPIALNATFAENDLIRKKEGERLLKHIKDSDYCITLEIDGKMLTSEGLSKEIDRLGLAGKSSLVFVIGGSLGLSGAVLNRADYRLSFSRMTFPHQLMRVILLEQIYRGFKIIAGEPYHK